MSIALLSPHSFFGGNEIAMRLFGAVQDTPIRDIHTHGDDNRLANNTPFENPWQALFEGDHYVSSCLRQRGVTEELVTGDANPKDKFQKVCEIMPHVSGNPVYFWTYYAIRKVLGLATAVIKADTADDLWEQIMEKLSEPEFLPRELLRRQGVADFATTDDPASNLANHQILAESDYEITVRPTFRPDRLTKFNQPGWKGYIRDLSHATNIQIASFDCLQKALAHQHQVFYEAGCRASDHGLDTMPTVFDEKIAQLAFSRAMADMEVPADQQEHFRGWLLYYMTELNAQVGNVTQLHIGPTRNTRSRYAHLGPDKGFDGSTSEFSLKGLWTYLDIVDSQLPGAKIVLYTMNEGVLHEMACQSRIFGSNIRLGAPWWIWDNVEGMRRFFKIVKGISLLSTLVGMVSDSRSIFSYAARFYMYRLVLCETLADEVCRGNIREEDAMEILLDIVERNPREFFNLTD